MAETYWRKALEKGYDDPRAIEERIRQLKSKPDYATSLNHSYRFPQRRSRSARCVFVCRRSFCFFFLLLGAGSLAAQNTDQQIAAQKRLIADLEKQIAREEQEISKLKKGRASAEETVRRLARQIDSRNQLLDVTERDARKLEVEVARTDSVARGCRHRSTPINGAMPRWCARHTATTNTTII